MKPVDLNFVECYVALWNEPDAQRRRQAIEALWTPNGGNYTPSIHAVGYDAINARVTSSYDKYVGPGTHYFRIHRPAVGHNRVVMLKWAMVTVPKERVVSVGVEFLVLDDQARIISDHQFIVE